MGVKLKKRASVQAFPERPPEPKHPQPAWSRAKEGLGRFDELHGSEDGTDWYVKAPKQAASPMPHPTESNPSKDGGPDYIKAGLTGLVAGTLLGPLGAVAGGAIGGQIFRKKK